MGSAWAPGRLPFRGSVAVASGWLTAQQLRGPHYQRLFPDVYVAADVPVDHRVLSIAAVMYAGDGAAASGLSGAYGWGIDLLPLGGARPEVTVPPNRRRMASRANLTVVRSALPGEVTRRGALRVTSPLRTAFDLARRLPRPDAVAAVDAVLFRHLVLLTDLRDYVALAGGRRGVGQARSVVELAEPRAESPMESRTRLVIVDGGLPRPIAQHEVYTPSGLFVARLDLAYPRWLIGIEYEGDHHRERSTFRRDIERGNRLADLDWTILRVTADDVLRNPDEMLRRLRKLISVARQDRK